MKVYTKIYMRYFGYGEQSFIPCEICGKRAVDIHHIIYRSQGGTNKIENLMALCRKHHDMAHNETINKAVLQARHEQFMEAN